MNKLYSSHYAYDISNKPITKGEAYDINAINISIENILLTYYGERIMFPEFGCVLPSVVFESFSDETFAEDVLANIIESIETWEDRIQILGDDVQMILNMDNNSMELILPYIVKDTNLKSSFEKRIIF